MGCWMSTEHRRSQNEDRRRRDGGAPSAPLPRSPPVEEAVKEVLSETRIVIPKVADGSKGTPTRDQAWKVDFGPAAAAALGRGNRNCTPPRRVNQERKGNGVGRESEEIVSEASELFSYSGSYSAAAAAAERRGKDIYEDGVVDQRPRPRKLPAPTAGRGRGEGVQGRKQAAASPERTVQVAPQRAVRGKSAAVVQPRNVVEERGPRRDPSEGSGRRSMTPERWIDGGGRRNGSEDKSAAGRGPPNDVVKVDEESLENPVVSLECFIFL